MTLRAMIAAAILAASPALAQEEVNDGNGAILRVLDKLNAKVFDITLANDETETIGRLEVTLRQCRFPVGDPTGNAYAFLTVREAGVVNSVFDGWMVASSPALNPLDHARYDVWVLRCTTP